MGIIYCYTNKINGKSYVGQTRYPKRRRYQHSHEVINGNKSKKPFYNAVLKYHTGKGREIRKCVYCGNEFSALKHRKQETCSRTCSNYLMWQRRKKNEQGE